MRTRIAIAAAAISISLTAFEAQAFPAPPSPMPSLSEVTQARAGCGPGWARDRWGHCRPIRRVAPGPRCWWQHGPWGSRRVCR
ncbi:GCG_CRPN prefix-to-repeats domain-containing protein [Methylocella silvestris]|uniref:Uncharacterized protein n=1 Tax=Methylocella silvestris TaxID=199596 RepID=A0A2J7TIZ5_METSI|nr:hypothetical protein CR492_07075 [Methylocella silvestris]